MITGPCAADDTRLSLSPLSIAVKPIITVTNTLLGATTCRTKRRYLSVVLSSPSSSTVEYVPPGGKMDSCSQATYYQAKSLPPTRRAQGVNMESRGHIYHDGVTLCTSCWVSEGMCVSNVR